MKNKIYIIFLLSLFVVYTSGFCDCIAAEKNHVCINHNSDKENDTKNDCNDCNDSQEEDSEDDLIHTDVFNICLFNNTDVKILLKSIYCFHFSNPLLEIDSPPPKV